MKEFITSNSDKLLTLASVMLGGFVTYFSTSATERLKNKRQLQRENLNQVLIPYCMCLEETKRNINKFYDKDSVQNLLIALNEPLQYLDANKRVYLDSFIRKRLENYGLNVQEFNNLLEKESEKCVSKYRMYIGDVLERIPDIGGAMGVAFSMSKDTQMRVKRSILTTTQISLLHNITSVEFIDNDEMENYHSRNININQEVIDALGAIECGVWSIEDEDDEEIAMGCKVLKYLEDNAKDEKEKLNNILKETRSADLLRKIIEDLQYMHIELIDEIDKITK